MCALGDGARALDTQWPGREGGQSVRELPGGNWYLAWLSKDETAPSGVAHDCLLPLRPAPVRAGPHQGAITCAQRPAGSTPGVGKLACPLAVSLSLFLRLPYLWFLALDLSRPDDARGWQCPFVLCLHPQGCLRRGVRASGPSHAETGQELETTGKGDGERGRERQQEVTTFYKSQLSHVIKRIFLVY